MISSLHLKSFQSHKDSHLDFVDGVNVIVGRSDSGKTAILRALKLLFTNRPGGDSQISTWADEMELTLTTTEGHTIKRGKGKENYYELDDQHFTTFGTEVPKEIREALNVDEAISLQKQFDQPFLLTESPGEVARHFNSIAHLEKIDSSVKKVQSWIRSLEQTITSNEKQISNLQSELEQYSYLEQMEIELAVLEGMETDLSMQRRQLSKLETLRKEAILVWNEIEELSYSILMEKEVDDLLNLYELKLADSRHLNSLSTLIYSHSEIVSEIALKGAIIALEPALDRLLADIKDLNMVLVPERDSLETLCDRVYSIEKQISDAEQILALEPMVDGVLGLYEDIIVVRKQQSDLRNSVGLISGLNIDIQATENRTDKLQEQFEEEMGEVCPLCDQVIEHKH